MSFHPRSIGARGCDAGDNRLLPPGPRSHQHPAQPGPTPGIKYWCPLLAPIWTDLKVWVKSTKTHFFCTFERLTIWHSFHFLRELKMKQSMKIHTSWLKPMMEMSWGWKSRYHTSCRILSWTCWPPLLPPPMMMLHNLKPTHSFLYSCQSERGSTLCFEVCQCKLFMKLYWSEQWTVPHTMVRLLDSRTQSHWNKREFNSNLRFF